MIADKMTRLIADNRQLAAELAALRAEQRRDAVDGQCALDEANGEIERLRAELAEAEADTIDATERVMLMRRDNQRAAAARRVAAYCRQQRKPK